MEKINKVPGQPGFTLMELLVVIAIIAVLALLVLSGMGNLRQKTMGVECVANLRSIGSVGGTFSAENNGLMPYERMQESPTSPYRNIDIESGWYFQKTESLKQVIAPQLHEPQSEPFKTRSSYVPNPRAVTIQQGGTFPWGFGLALNNATGLVYRAQIARPAGTFTFACRGTANPVVGWLDGTPFYWKNPGSHPGATHQFAFNHSGRANFLFADGHVESITTEEFEERGRTLFGYEP